MTNNIVPQEALEEMVATGAVETEIEATGELDIVNTSNDETSEAVRSKEPAQNQTNTITFEDRAEAMGLENLGGGAFMHSDQFGVVLYRTLHTLAEAGHADHRQISDLGIFTRKTGSEDSYLYCGTISNSYQFLGNSTLINNIRNSITEVGQSAIEETTMSSSNLTQFRGELVIQNSANIPEAGDVYPQIVVTNSYDGSKAANIAFGIFIGGSNSIRCAFRSEDRLGTIRQVHHTGARSSLTTAVRGFVDIFSENINELVTSSFNQPISDEEMFSILDSIEVTGKKRRLEISTYLEQTGQNQPLNAWKMFLAITRFSTLETNLNVKKVLENVAERVLVIPTQMINAVRALRETT